MKMRKHVYTCEWVYVYMCVNVCVSECGIGREERDLGKDNEKPIQGPRGDFTCV